MRTNDGYNSVICSFFLFLLNYMLWAPFPVRTYWLPHTRHAVKWIFYNSFNQSSTETLKSLFCQKHPACKQTTNHVNVRASQPGPRPTPAAPSEWRVPASQWTLRTLQIAGWEDSCHWLPSPARGWKSSLQGVTDNSPHFQGNSRNTEARPRMSLIWMCFQKSQSCQHSRTWGLLPRLTFVFRVPPLANGTGKGGKMEKAIQLRQHRWSCLFLLFLNIKEWKEIETPCQKSEFCRKQFSDISRALKMPLGLWPRGRISGQPKETITLVQKY